MLKSLFILSSSKISSFCYYDSIKGNGHLISPKLLENILEWCENEMIIPYILFQRKLLSLEYKKILSRFQHNKICFSVNDITNLNDILVLSSKNLKVKKSSYIKGFPKVSTIILRLYKSDLNNLKSIFISFWGQFDRFNLILSDLDSYSQEEIALYKSSIREIEKYLSGLDVLYMPEISFITDRIILNDMRNCNAGIDHITIASNGDLFLCPGFSTNRLFKIGTFTDTLQYKINDEKLLQIEYSPICSICDCFHCKRCHWLNYKGTLELNTPTYQQCVISHIERELSRNLMMSNKKYPINETLSIPISYLDPLDVVESRRINQPLDTFILRKQNNKIDDSLYLILNDLVAKFGAEQIDNTLKAIFYEKQ